jgi:hypothetical protein
VDDLKEMTRYWNLKKEAPDRTLRRTQFGRGNGSVTKQTVECMKPNIHLQAYFFLADARWKKFHGSFQET